MMNESSHAHHPASSEAIDALTRIIIDESIDLIKLGDCGITLEEFTLGETVIVLECAHAYKEASILEWLQHHDTCPVCRKKVDSPTSQISPCLSPILSSPTQSLPSNEIRET